MTSIALARFRQLRYYNGFRADPGRTLICYTMPRKQGLVLAKSPRMLSVEENFPERGFCVFLVARHLRQLSS